MNRWEIILGIVFGLLVNEITDVSPWLARKLVRWSACRWTVNPEIGAAYAEEWAAVIDERPGKLFKLLTALQFALGAAGRAAPRAGMRATRAILLRYWALRSKPQEGTIGPIHIKLDATSPATELDSDLFNMYAESRAKKPDRLLMAEIESELERSRAKLRNTWPKSSRVALRSGRTEATGLESRSGQEPG